MQFPSTVVLRPGRLKWAGIGLFCLLFTVVGVWLGLKGDKIGWGCAIIFGLGVLISTVCLLPNATYLRLTDDGFTICSMYRTHTYRWQEVTGFAVGRVFRNKMVLFNFEPTYQRTPGLRSINVGMVGYEAGLPDTYGLTHEALAEMLNQFKASSHGAR
ncbi:hypothetical protein V5E97_07100 [Singulisphaera sp. Ch08]|uniref:PH domain-containing protein n=1 Tax=Singulisphaera sp. Ch08 TaxID=3120278 RepID=A0AAU7CKY3_9BACT